MGIPGNNKGIGFSIVPAIGGRDRGRDGGHDGGRHRVTQNVGGVFRATTSLMPEPTHSPTDRLHSKSGRQQRRRVTGKATLSLPPYANADSQNPTATYIGFIASLTVTRECSAF